jgi:hypothetical protein
MFSNKSQYQGFQIIPIFLSILLMFCTARLIAELESGKLYNPPFIIYHILFVKLMLVQRKQKYFYLLSVL